ncbi:hypothetical protein EJB05_40011 [Eragrostis curvula]|uniref:Uncharacterized protein n=1 Tax=Eragrostis curvula TaxID=38414 RepID=A0A5J9TYN3_9POAL|nr:hypothetical protein EJB05_40011 [Eragrostis curvula]
MGELSPLFRFARARGAQILSPAGSASIPFDPIRFDWEEEGNFEEKGRAPGCAMAQAPNSIQS